MNSSRVRIAIASGKGGTGKTTVATSLALSLVRQAEHPAIGAVVPLLLDCDVEAPNAHLFLQPSFETQQPVGILIPQVAEKKCTYCGKCAQVCQYHAIAVLGSKTLVFPQLCHGCGSCSLICPEGAISETLEVIGTLERGHTPSGVDLARGKLNVGEPMAVPVIRQLKRWADPEPGQVMIVDAAPGTSCPVVEAVRGADYVVLVTEPTPFGFHDLKLALEVAKTLKMPVGVVINRDGIAQASGDFSEQMADYCRQEGLPILMRIPFERRIAAGIAEGKPLIDICPETLPLFREMFLQIVNEIQQRSKDQE